MQEFIDELNNNFSGNGRKFSFRFLHCRNVNFNNRHTCSYTYLFSVIILLYYCSLIYLIEKYKRKLDPRHFFIRCKEGRGI